MKFAAIQISLVFIFLSETNYLINIDSVDAVQSGSSRFRCWNPRGQFPHAIYCDWFYNCWDGAVFEQQCPQELAFNVAIQACDFPANVDCGRRLLSWNRERNFRCPKLHGVFADSTRGCSAFVICDRGAPVEFTCPETLHFNPATSVCDYPYKVWPPCELDTPAKPGDFSCPRANGNFPYDDFCEKYWMCVEYRATLITCATGTLFDGRYEQCIDSKYVQCFQLPVHAALEFTQSRSDIAFADNSTERRTIEM